MSALGLLPTEKIQIGNTAGYHLAFYGEESVGDARNPKDQPDLEIGSSEYYADVRAALPDGLSGGTYTITLEGITDAHYGQIRALPYVKLFLYWLDTNSSAGSYLKNIAGLTDTLSKVSADDLGDSLVAVLKIDKVQRRGGERRYVAVIEAREWVFERLSSTRLGALEAGTEGTAANFEAAVDAVLQRRGAHLRKDTDYKFNAVTDNDVCPPAPAPDQSDDQTALLVQGKTIQDLMATLAARMEERSGRYGRGMLLLRNGCLHIGVRAIPLEGETKRLSLSTGLVESESLADVETDPNFDFAAHPTETPAKRQQFKLTLKGRADLKPGDMVEFVPSPEDSAPTNGSLLGSIGSLLQGPLLPSIGGEDFSNSVKLYVNTVEHRLGRTTSFVTIVTGVAITVPTETWDCHTPAQQPAHAQGSEHATPEAAIAQAVHGITRRALDARTLAEIGEVRRANSSGQSEPPSQTLSVWRGLRPGGSNNSARRMDIQRPSPAPAAGVPYLTPFAFGKCGLVLPRYPGTRVMVMHRDGRADDPVEIGALWASGHGPDSQAGDWWLILPVGVASDRRESLPASNVDAPQEHTGKVTQDLIDADGNRVIEVGELTISIGRDSKLKDAGTRPTRGTTDAVTIQHLSGEAKIVIGQDGKITIQGKNIDLDAGTGNISMKAANVDVQVSGAMDVHG